MYIRDTIAAISTPPGNGGIGIIRVSGDMAAAIGEALFKCAASGGLISHRFCFGTIIDPFRNALVDEAMAVLMKAPRSYTREDVLELHCHGGMLVVEKVLSLVLACGARLADPGEFTRRAFLNGRIDLVQAEAIMDIISSKTEAALTVAQGQREGVVSHRIDQIRSLLLRALALVEAYIDFPEDDLGVADFSIIQSSVTEARTISTSLLSGFDDCRMLREGISALIIGKPNAGKSSLLNSLLDENRAIVTHIPGTTRDIIEETLNIGGLPVRLLDTAGIRHTNDVVEQEGIQRALAKVNQADVVLFVVDASRPFDSEDQLILESLVGSNVLVVLNKTDLTTEFDSSLIPKEWRQVSVSAITGDGMQLLKDVLRSLFIHESSLDSREFISISRARHRDALVSVNSSLQSVLDGLSSGLGLELLSVDLRQALSDVGSVTGQTTPDDVLDIVFSSFCIGK